jgi:hypothetical protein
MLLMCSVHKRSAADDYPSKRDPHNNDPRLFAGSVTPPSSCRKILVCILRILIPSSSKMLSRDRKHAAALDLRSILWLCFVTDNAKAQGDEPRKVSMSRKSKSRD